MTLGLELSERTFVSHQTGTTYRVPDSACTQSDARSLGLQAVTEQKTKMLVLSSLLEVRNAKISTQKGTISRLRDKLADREFDGYYGGY